MHIYKRVKALFVLCPAILLAACSGSKQPIEAMPQEQKLASGESVAHHLTSKKAYHDEKAHIAELQLSSTVHFDFDKYNITAAAGNILDEHAKFLKNNPHINVTIQGHTDSRGTPEYNIALGERRAKAVKLYLQGRGVPESQMSVVSYGQEKPMDLSYDKEAMQKNRRAVVVYS